MDQLPIFTNISGRNVVLLGDGEAADAKRRLIERAGGICVPDCPNAICACARIAFVALDDEDEAVQQAQRLRGKGILVNVVDRPDHCDFTTPAIVDRDPVLIAVGTGGASAGMAKAVRQRIEAILPQSLGTLARSVSAARDAIRARWPEASARRRALDEAFRPGGTLDPGRDHQDGAVAHWLQSDQSEAHNGVITVQLSSDDPDDLTLRTARLLGEADYIFYTADVPAAILARARADAARQLGPVPSTPPPGLCLHLTLSPDTPL
jgi:uroporphyrin-III C-methyltransferase / precorrin-2 dehydrogenase / sirohydrochlorin ferrochelatase